VAVILVELCDFDNVSNKISKSSFYEFCIRNNTPCEHCIYLPVRLYVSMTLKRLTLNLEFGRLLIEL
jgi:hypothetical protein